MTDEDDGQSEYNYSDAQRRAVLDAIDLPDEAAQDALMSDLTRLARAAIAHNVRIPRRTYSGVARRELEVLRTAISDLGVETREVLDDILIDGLDVSVEQLMAAIEAAVARTAVEFPARGRPRHPAAELFISRCFYRWLSYKSEVPPKNPSSRSPFYGFVSAALPAEVYDRSGRTHVGEGITGLLRRVLAKTHVHFQHRVRLDWVD